MRGLGVENFRLKVFRVVARHASFTRAAEELLLTQPAVTAQVKALEEELGVALFDRGVGRAGGGIGLTAAGAALLPFAERLKGLAAEAAGAVAGSSGGAGGTLALGASQTIAQYVLPRLVAEFRREHARVEVTAISGNTERMLEELTAQRIQLALVEGPARRKDVQVRAFLEDELVLVVPAGHEWAGREIDLEALRDAPMLMREIGSGTRRVVEEALRKAGLKRREMRIGMELDSTEGLLSAVEAGLGVTFASRWAARNHVAVGSLKEVRVAGLRVVRKFSVAWAAGPEPAGVAGVFLRWVAGVEKSPR